jgi:hypothetical protein
MELHVHSPLPFQNGVHRLHFRFLDTILYTFHFHFRINYLIPHFHLLLAVEWNVLPRKVKLSLSLIKHRHVNMYDCIQVHLILTSTLEFPTSVTLLPAKSPLARLGLRSCMQVLLPGIEIQFHVFQLVVYLSYWWSCAYWDRYNV